MSDRLHAKYHRRNHHTYTNSANPDAGHDPIASPESPFLGDFVLNGALTVSAAASAYAGYFASNNNALVAESPTMAICSLGNAKVVGDLCVTGTLYSNVSGGGGGGGGCGVSYNFLCGLSSDNANNVKSQFDNNTIKLNGSNQLYVNVASLVPLLSSPGGCTVVCGSNFAFTNGLAASAVGISGNSYSVGAVVDNSTIKISNGVLTSGISFSNGVSASPAGLVGVNVDSSTIKIESGVLKLVKDYNFTSGSGLTNCNNSICVVPDNNTICVNGSNQLYSTFTAGSGICFNNKAISVKTDNANTCINTSNGSLGIYNIVKTNQAGSIQSIQGNLNLEGTISAAKVSFSDGSFIDSSYQSKPFIKDLADFRSTGPHGLVITSDNRLVGWGWNNHFAYGTPSSIWPPETLSFADNYTIFNKNVSISKVISSARNTLILLSDGTLWASGANGSKTLTNGVASLNSSYEFVFARQKPMGRTTDSIKFTSIESAYNYREDQSSLGNLGAITDNGILFVWGDNIDGSLGLKNSTPQVYPTSAVPALTGLYAQGFKAVQVAFSQAASDANTLVLMASGTLSNGLSACTTRVYSSGNNASGTLSIGTIVDVNTFTLAISSANVSRIINNPTNTQSKFILKTDGYLWSVGLNQSGVMGRGIASTSHKSTSFLPISAVPNVIDAGSTNASGYASVMAITAAGQVYSWGDNSYGILGNGNTTDSNVPIQVGASIFTSKPAARLFASTSFNNGGQFSVLTRDKYLYNIGYQTPAQQNGFAKVATSFVSYPIPNITNFQHIVNDNGTVIGTVAKDTYNRVFVTVEDNGYYLSGATNLPIRQPAEFTNFLV